MEKAGLKADFIQGQRVTDEATVKIVDDVLSREINPGDCQNHQRARRRGRSALPGRTFSSAASSGSTTRKIRAGKLTSATSAKSSRSTPRRLKECIWCGFTPVISPTARGEDGKIYNCNADVAAAQAAIALKAKRLVFMSDVPGLLRDPKQPDSRHPASANRRGGRAQTAGVIDKGMIPKVDSAVAAIQSGVEKVSFVDGRVPHAVLLEIFTDEGVGTEIVL